MLNGTTLIVVGLLAALVLVAYARGGSALVSRGLSDGAALLWRFGLLIAVSFLAAGLVETLIPHDWIRASLGEGSGLRGILLGTAAGAITPAGPFVAMPIAAVMIRSGAATGPIVAFVAGWSLLALHRLIAWEVPILGWRLAALRYATCLALPIVAGLLARAVAR